MTKQAPLAVAVLTLLFGGETLVAGEYAVEISGADGTVAGTCLLVTAKQYARRDVSGTLPLRLEFSGDLISCAIQRKAGFGYLHIVIKDAAGYTVGESADAQPFGVAIAAGR